MKFNKYLLCLLAAVCFLPYSASALVMRDNGPEPIIIQIKESLRLSDDLDNRLSELAAAHNQNGLQVLKWHAGDKLLVMLSFPSNFTEQHALAVIAALQLLPAVEKIVPASAANLEFKVTDFTREYAPNQIMPDVARRGLDRDELRRSVMTSAQIEEAAQLEHAPNQVIVRWKPRYVWRATPGGFLRDIANFHAAGGGHVLRETRMSPTDLTQVIEFDDQVTPFVNKLRRYAECPWVDYAQPNFIYQVAAVNPNDPLYTNPYPGQQSLPKVSAPSAWAVTTGTQSVVVAVGDSGANINHPDFAPTPPPPPATPIPSNISPGWRNFSVHPPNNDVSDPRNPAHGQHVASILGAKGNNGQYMTGVAWNVSLLILKVFDPVSGIAYSADIADAINYAWSSEGHAPAIAINFSIKTMIGSGIDEVLHQAILQARAHNMAVVAAGGNFSSNMDDGLNNNLVSPACIPTDNVIAVGMTRVRPDDPSRDDTKADLSNWGRYRVELGAPGGEDGQFYDAWGILGLVTNPNANPTWVRMGGTSMAAPHVSGAMALVKSKYPWEDYLGLRDRVAMGTDDVPALSTLFRSGGRLNLNKALKTRTLIKNWSTRAKVESSDRIIVGGFTIGGSPAVTLKVAIRGLGPSLAPLAVPRLNDPKLQLNNSIGGVIFSNDDWGNLPQSQKTDLANAGLTPTNIHEAAMVAQLYPGSYTVLMQSQDGQQGVGLFEIYELRGLVTEENRLKNISVRCPVGLGDEVAIAGTLLQNPTTGDVPKRRLLMAGRGPSLQPLVTGTLPNPYLELRNSSGAIIGFNDQWKDIDSTSTGLEDKLVDSQFRPPPTAPEQYLNESNLWPTLAGGTYTCTLRDAANATGIGLLEIYEY